ncbi:helix-turn-helix domain-containing protein [Trueperella pecoris]|uniref:Helix-turn-helix domain-containing protein n=1 Tax=Trueperella pecoris TaxID=2733571 RepID=A0A7M1QVG2_9ACTO|nr:helix-turn-helix domain-containing protein [Trueperella pecoris]QOQ39318.1 helix-turn-helix domain-containing protein [Trueperella pecoris]QOR46040.1 helix-turn-helix domain-containing protein [Trueperella pecoris]QTG75870.1 helix-turn-helix domain-containing protein [Trueperella pecoris]
MAQLPPSVPQFFTVAEVAELTRVSRMTVYRMVHSGDLPAVRVGSSYRVPKSAVDKLLSSGMDQAAGA